MLRRSLAYAIADAGRAVGVLVRQIGGVRTLRDYPGSGRDPLLPTDAATQRQALELIAHNVLSIDGLAVTPALQRRLAPDFDDRGDNPALPTDYSVPQRLLDLQRAVLNQLMSDAVAARILDSVGKADRPEAAFQLSELYERLNRDIWSELAKGGNISATRRELQRDHVNRVANSLFRPNPQARADARSLLRVQAQQLQAQLDKALKRRAPMDAESRAHLQDSADTLSQALSASSIAPASEPAAPARPGSRHSQAAPRTPEASPWRLGTQPRAHAVLQPTREHPAAPQPRHLLVEQVDLRQPAGEHDDVRIEQVDHAASARASREAWRCSVAWHAASPCRGRARRSARPSASAPPKCRCSRARPGPLSSVSMQPRWPQ